MPEPSHILFIAGLGAIMEEIMHWHSKRYEILKGEFKINPKGWKIYLTIVLLVVTASSIGTAALFSNRTEPQLFDALIFGAAFPALFKTATKGASSGRSEVKLGRQKASFGEILKFYLR